jgi:hypothetical protein
MANEVIDRYQIKEKIGAGGMGTVYRAWDSEIERDVALKWLPAYFSADVTFTERFKREARVVARLEHPHIVPIYDVGESEGRPFIIMRLLNGGTLREQTGKSGFDLAALVQALEQIGDALTAAHARQIVHRDIKPGNILFDENGAAFLSDFGIAKVLDSATQLTGSGFIGTPAYMSPEQFVGQGIDGRSDQYALAIVVYESLTGSLPFKGNTAQMMYKHINAEPPVINLDEHPIPDGLNPVLQKALSKDPNDRYARIKDFVTAMKVAVRENPAAAATLLPLAAAGALLSTPQKPSTAPTALDTPAEQMTEQLQKDYRDGLEAMSRSEWAAAIAAFDRVLQVAPDYGNAVEFKRQAEVNLGPVTPTQDVEETGLDDGAPAVVAAGALAAASAADVEQASLDLPAAAEGVSSVDMTEVEMAEADLDKTSLDLPVEAAVPLAAAGTAAGAATAETSLDLPSAATAAPQAAALPHPSSTEPPSTEPQEKRGGIPIWAMAVAVILLLLLCGGAVYAGVNFFGGGEEDTLASRDTGDSDAGNVIAVAEGQDTEGDADDVDAVIAPTRTAKLETTETSTPELVEESTAVPILAEASEVPPTLTEAPSETPKPEFLIVRVNVASANLRRGPSTIFPVLRPIFLDERTTVLAKNSDGSWYNVELEDGSRAWLAASVVELVNDVAANDVPLAATIPVAPTWTPVPPTWTPLPIPPTLTPLPPGGESGDDDDDDNGGDYTPDPNP